MTLIEGGWRPDQVEVFHVEREDGPGPLVLDAAVTEGGIEFACLGSAAQLFAQALDENEADRLACHGATLQQVVREGRLGGGCDPEREGEWCRPPEFPEQVLDPVHLCLQGLRAGEEAFAGRRQRMALISVTR